MELVYGRCAELNNIDVYKIVFVFVLAYNFVFDKCIDLFLSDSFVFENLWATISTLASQY